MKRILIGILAGIAAVATAIAADNFNVLDKLNISFSTATITGQLAPANGGSGVANSKNLTWSNSLTLAGTDATTMTFPSTSATIARTDAANTFTGHQTIEGVTATGATGSGAMVFGTSPTFTTGATSPTWLVTSTNVNLAKWSGGDGMTFGGTNGDVLTLNNSRAITAGGPLLISSGTTANQLRTAQTTVPTCTTNCGTGSPTVAGTDTAGIITLGTTPASAFQVNFNGTWASAPSCIVQSALATMVVGKMPIAVVTSTGNFVVTTNGTAPATSDKYQYICVGVS